MSTNPDGLGRLFRSQGFAVSELQFARPTAAVVSSFDPTTGAIIVNVPSFDGGVAEFGPINWSAPTDTVTPGDTILIVSDENDSLWVISSQGGGSQATGQAPATPAFKKTPASSSTPQPSGVNDFSQAPASRSIGASRPPTDIKIIVLHSSEIDYTPSVDDSLLSLQNSLDAEFIYAGVGAAPGTSGPYPGSDPTHEYSSIHLGVDGDGTTMRMVDDLHVAHHVYKFNPQSLGIEQIGFATPFDTPGSPANNHYTHFPWSHAQIQTVAKWIAYWSGQYGIPIVHSTSNGVCRHQDLGADGGGHADPGEDYPFNKVLSMAARLAK